MKHDDDCCHSGGVMPCICALPTTDTPGTLEERLRATVRIVKDADSGKSYKRLRNPDGPEAADEIASLRARVEAAEDELTETVEHLEAVLFSDPGPKMLASIGSARAWWLKRDAREEAEALKDTP